MSTTAVSPIRVVVADDHTLFRDGLRQLLDFEEGVHVIAEASDGEEAVAVAVKERPDVMLLDVEMPGPGAVATVERIRIGSPNTAIVILTMHDDRQIITDLLRLGVRGYLLKNVSRTELVGVVRDAVRRSGHVVLSVSADSFLQPGHDLAELLSSREEQVLTLASQALTNSQIARRLNISEATVKRHLYNVFAKLGAVSRIDAVNKYFGTDRRTAR